MQPVDGAGDHILDRSPDNEWGSPDLAFEPYRGRGRRKRYALRVHWLAPDCAGHNPRALFPIARYAARSLADFRAVLDYWDRDERFYCAIDDRARRRRVPEDLARGLLGLGGRERGGPS